MTWSGPSHFDLSKKTAGEPRTKETVCRKHNPPKKTSFLFFQEVKRDPDKRGMFSWFYFKHMAQLLSKLDQLNMLISYVFGAFLLRYTRNNFTDSATASSACLASEGC